MTGVFCLSLKARQRLFINGAVLRFDRKVGVELLNDAVFLLESHVLQPDEITTPLRQLYFIAQTILMDPDCRERAEVIFRDQFAALKYIYVSETMTAGLNDVRTQFEARRIVEALKTIRRLFPLEADILAIKPTAGAHGAGSAASVVA
jgi:flagellar biosynthesis repressor protein FlbT